MTPRLLRPTCSADASVAAQAANDICRGLYVYECGPIDHWQGWTPLPTFLRDEFIDPGQVGRMLQAIARSTRWEGDFRAGEAPRVSALPVGDPDCALLLAVKQDNNGTTFIASEVRLPWLDEDLIHAEP